MDIAVKTGEWISLMDYATKNGVSLSTLRRHIKSNKVRYRVEEGRYLIFDDHETHETRETNDSSEQLRAVELELRKAREEISELRMLVAIYEEQTARPRLDN